MSITGFCVLDDHKGCPDTKKDRQVCDCPCHLSGNVVHDLKDDLGRKIDKEAKKFKEAWDRLEGKS